MAKLLSLSLDLTKIDKSKINQHSNGSLYYEITVSVNDEPNQHGQDVSAWNKQTKEQQTAKEKKEYIGNGKVFWSSDAKPLQNITSTAEVVSGNAIDGLPF